ncbi:uncharacterized protein LOC130648563 [Hydractinia symbiolongicarpus]|uniref:uncharacterized protein LOC130648563 n=1 Tax=Hydractinia symbiolongicarpus TaxID=13093 RepID=UPI002551AFD7|nr:uncharacterized protein LOC130648563 [Hydractinia symbiolongicarpus]
MENLRTQYRRKHRELSANLKELYEGTYGKSYTLKIESMKSFVMMKRERRQRLRERQNLGDIESSERKMKFLVNEIIQLISYLQESFTSSLSTLDDKEIKKRKEDLPEQLSQMETLRKSFKEMIETAKRKDEGNLDDLNKRYDKLVDLKNCYIKTLDQEYQDRELSKVEKFNSSTLNIKLPIFKGYGSVCDIYTFQTDFEKLYLRSTPNAVLPDLLKNNFLEHPALTLVRNVTNINEIWRRLKDAYGDQKTLLSKKLAELNKTELKHKDPEKVVEGLSHIVNIMKDLIHLAKCHRIENELFYGDGLERIYKLIGDNRVTRWLAASCDDDSVGESKWHKLITFLE